MNALMIAGTAIRQDEDGRYCLNDLHRASGYARRHSPKEWVRTQQTQELVAEIEQGGNSRLALNVVHGGTGRGTYACKELVYSYAMWISPKFHLHVVRTFDAVVTQRAANDEFAQGAIREFQTTRAEVLEGIVKVNAAVMQLGSAYGLAGNQLLLYTNKAVEKQTGIAPMALLGISGLINDSQELHYTPTELGRKFGMTAIAINRLLGSMGLQRQFEYAPNKRRWELTPAGRQHGVILDTAKRHSDGTPVQQIRWKESILKELKDYADRIMTGTPSTYGERAARPLRA